ncbi:MAG: ATP-grasp domain-containing protein [Acidimicrobiia bacterium]|nr:ATP-grasp domain-containing protein [Acidimicrobiia bacterium]
MIRRLLIANRGEIAVRIARTAHLLGIDTVGVYSEPDRHALHVGAVDRAVALGGATPSESYLRAEAVLEAARTTDCDAVHPGYGFLAENARFAEAVVSAGMIWVGPTPEQIELLGDKVAAKRAAVEAGVPTIPVIAVEPGNVPDDVPIPALVKAAAGGGGRGMRVVRSAGELGGAVEAAAREAESAFGDGTVFVEPFVENGRHVEVQILGDAHGNAVHLGERECSIQRRNQKVLEEAPSAGIDQATRAALCDGALALARHVSYVNAGTVEFLVDETGGITFLEVNTRLQVEHPVTEAVTGLDLVELQLRVAAGEPLPLTQTDVVISGHAIEVRLVAEDPATGWLPQAGVLDAFEIPGDVRTDAGVRAGSVVSADYDSLLAKVIAHAPTRGEAAQRLARALRRARIDGLRTDRDALVSLLEDDDFLAAATPTRFLEDHPDLLSSRGPDGDDRLALLVAACVATEMQHRADDRLWGFAPSGWRNLRTRGQRRVFHDEGTGEEAALEYVRRSSDDLLFLVGAWPGFDDEGAQLADDRRQVTVRVLGHSIHDSNDDGVDRFAVELDGVRRSVSVRSADDRIETAGSAGSATWRLIPRFVDHDAEMAGGGPHAPLPGTVISVDVTEGETVSDGQVLLVLEAMKMEHRITAHGSAVVTEVLVATGDKVEAGDILVHLES